MSYPTITLTGIDTKTPMEWVKRAARNTHIELGILYSANPQGNRYMTVPQILKVFEEIPQRRFALHVCGREARQKLLLGHPDIKELLAYDRVARIQVNGKITHLEVERLCYAYWDHEVITQHNDQNDHCSAFLDQHHALLVDGSGGTGKVPESWVYPETIKHVGFAGGLGPHNLAEEVPKIMEAVRARGAGGNWWVDMETHLRTDDWFDVQKAEAAVTTFRDTYFDTCRRFDDDDWELTHLKAYP